MSLQRITGTDLLARLDGFDAVIDARSPSEFSEDRLPGALNWPVLSDEERRIVGTEYKQVSPFMAQKRGAAMVARNIAAHIEREAFDKPKNWQPLIYCWRGGKRSGSLALVLDQIGFKVTLLEGGYREFRRAVIGALDVLPPQLDLRVVCGPTGSGKSRLLHALARQGVQVLDLEALAHHRGSVLGGVPGEPQPGQKQFESRLWNTMRRFDTGLPVWVESESRKIGDLRVPERLIERMRCAPCLSIEMPLPSRVNLLLEDYSFFVNDVEAFCERLSALRELRGKPQVQAWQQAAREGGLRGVVQGLLEKHYDPSYLQSMQRNFAGFDQARRVPVVDGNTPTLDALAAALIPHPA